MSIHTRDGGVLRTEAPAKINWTLEVLGKRPDGYHEIRSVMQTLSLADTLELRPAEHFSLTVDGPEAGGAGDIEANLVSRAVRSVPALLARRPVAFRLTKRIPAAAGLGGGSSDAAAALRLLQVYWEILDRERLYEVAGALGSDVSFFLRGGVQLAAGRGDKVKPLPFVQTSGLVLLTPPIAVERKTAHLYAHIHPARYTSGEVTAHLAELMHIGTAPSAESYYNVFDGVADQVFPGLDQFRTSLSQVTGSPALLVGAGPTLFAHSREPAKAVRYLRGQGHNAWEVSTPALDAGRSPFGAC